MKKLLFYFLLMTALFSACKKDDSDLFGKSPDERLNESLAAYQNQLAGATNGWKGFIYPRSGGVYSFYFKFNEANRVNMLSSFDSASAVTLKESSYRLKALQQPSLLFDTYSYLHVLADPDPNENGGIVGAGLRSDFEFYFDAGSADTINLVGRLNGSRATLIKATPEEAAGFINGQLATGFLLNKLQTYFKRVTIGSERFDFNINPSTRTISMVDATGNLLDTTITTGYYMTFGGIGFIKPLVAGSQNISGISNLTYNQLSQTISCTVNNTAATISNVIVPLKADLNAPRRWWNAVVPDSSYWVSIEGFHVDGIEDAFHIRNLPDFSILVYYPNFVNLPVGIGDALLFVRQNDFYGPIMSSPPTFTGGRAIFNASGYEYPSPAGTPTDPIIQTRTKITIPDGYYFVQTSQSSYDMVSAVDGRSWMSWQ